jgi:acyl-CoA reductase-like NAD-dependent aldehyde dehydrogenase
MLIVNSGGNDPAVVFPDVDVDKVAEKVTLHSRFKVNPILTR